MLRRPKVLWRWLRWKPGPLRRSTEWLGDNFPEFPTPSPMQLIVARLPLTIW